MKKLAAAALAFGLVLSALASSIPKGTDIRLAFEEDLSSKTAKVGDKVYFHVVEDIMIEGQVVIRKGTPASGTVTQVNKGRRFGVNGNVRIQLEPIQAVDGTAVPIATRNKGKKTGSKTDTAAMASAGGALVLGPVGLGIGYFITGKHLNVKAGDTMATEVTSDIKLGS